MAAPKGAMSSPFGTNGDGYGNIAREALDAMDRMHPSLKTQDKLAQDNQKRLDDSNPNVVESKPQKTVEVKPKKTKKAEVSDLENLEVYEGGTKTGVFDQEIKNELLNILISNEINIISLDNSKIMFECKGNKFLLLPV